ncbi:MAG: hypothetical protein KBT36_04910 [Kurthia sp.]|uniref:hypothetical protein n=1 Tax=Solibacillus sp. FSL H8-0523 TaxID=2954511 RepID=UPI001B50E82F|nr:hypothetical protein [Candidatus Kurthia equi]
MKEKIKSFEEFEERLRDQPMPEIQSIEVFEEHIFEKNNRFKPYTKFSIATVLVSLFAFATIGFAFETINWKFFNGEGEEIYNIQPIDEIDAERENERQRINRKYNSIRNDIKENLSDGKFAYFITTEGYEFNPTLVDFIVDDQKIVSVTEIPSNLSNFLHLKDELLDAYTLSEGLIYYQFPEIDSTEKAEELYLKAKQEGVPYMVQEGDLTSEVSSLHLLYSHKEKEKYQGFQINISDAGRSMHTTQDLTQYTRINEMGMEFLFNQNEQELLFILEENDKNLMVEIRFNYKEGLEELLAIVKDVINN